MALLSVSGLKAWYGMTQVLHGLDFALEEGSVAAILGANGAGKTTLLRALCGMIRREGAVAFEDRALDRMTTEDIVRLGVAHVPEGRGTFGRLTVEENLRLAALTRRRGAAAKAGFELVYSYFPRLAERQRQQAGTLSGGEQQMLAIGRALMLRPRLMLLDEPSFGLAPQVTRDIFRILTDIARNASVSMLLVEQNATLALELADQAHLLETGRLILSGSSADFRADEAVRRTYLGY